jgi:hypothetical protein
MDAVDIGIYQLIYRIEYQYVPHGKKSPDLTKTVVDSEFESEAGFLLIPNKGDYVCKEHSEKLSVIHGVVQSRCFSYLDSKERQLCVITIVVKEGNKNQALYG